MGLFTELGKALFTVGKGTLKVTGEIANYVIKDATGIDMKSEYEGQQEMRQYAQDIDKEISDLRYHQDEFIKEYGKREYENAIRELEKEREDMIEAINERKESFREYIQETKNSMDRYKREEYRRKVEELSEKQLSMLKNKEGASDMLKEVVNEEIQKREKEKPLYKSI